MYERILVPLDGSKEAEEALPLVKMIAMRLNSEVDLLTVTIIGDRMERPLRAYLEKIADSLQSLGIRATPILVKDFAAEGILDFANKNNVDLVVLCSHGQSTPRRWALGSVARKVLYGIHIPILLVKPESQAMLQPQLQRVLVPLDGSPFSEESLPYVEQLVKGSECEIILLRVSEPLTLPTEVQSAVQRSGGACVNMLMEQVWHDGLTYLEEVKSRFDGKANITAIHIDQGKASESIIQVAREKQVDLIAMTTQGYSSIVSWVYGSVANQVAEDSSQPVLLIRPGVNI